MSIGDQELLLYQDEDECPRSHFWSHSKGKSWSTWQMSHLLDDCPSFRLQTQGTCLTWTLKLSILDTGLSVLSNSHLCLHFCLQKMCVLHNCKMKTINVGLNFYLFEMLPLLLHSNFQNKWLIQKSFILNFSMALKPFFKPKQWDNTYYIWSMKNNHFARIIVTPPMKSFQKHFSVCQNEETIQDFVGG